MAGRGCPFTPAPSTSVPHPNLLVLALPLQPSASALQALKPQRPPPIPPPPPNQHAPFTAPTHFPPPPLPPHPLTFKCRIDIDWEYPGDLNRGGTVQDKRNLGLFFREFRAEQRRRGRRYLLTMSTAATAAGRAGEHTLTRARRAQGLQDHFAAAQEPREACGWRPPACHRPPPVAVARTAWMRPCVCCARCGHQIGLRVLRPLRSPGRPACAVPAAVTRSACAALRPLVGAPRRAAGLDMPAMIATLDYISIMTYDFHGACERGGVCLYACVLFCWIDGLVWVVRWEGVIGRRFGPGQSSCWLGWV